MFRIIPEAESYHEYVLLKDGQSLLFRAASPADLPVVGALLNGVSRESLQMRFMGSVAQVSQRFLEDLCTNDPKDRYCILAIQGEAPEHQVIGLGNYVGMGGRNKAEVAFLVADAHQGHGISTLLLDRLAGVAAGQGYVGFEAEVLYDNQKMLQVFKASGFEIRQAFEGGCVHMEFPVGGVVAVRERGELRDRIATANSLLPLLKPNRVAVVGASRDPAGVGSLIFRYLLEAGFKGTVFPVHRQAGSIHGVRAYASLLHLQEPVDLVVVAVPAPQVLEVAEDALKAGARALVVVTSGFAEAGSEGAAQQKKLVDLVRSGGARLVGPNCLGLMNTNPDTRLNASLAPRMPPRGRIAFFSHSAALGLVIIDFAVERGLGFSTFVTAGNRADVSGNDLLQYWEEDPETDMALLYLETFGNPRRFARVARRFARRKPILCVKSARSRAGRDAAMAHIAAPSQGNAATEVLFRQAGVIRADTLEEMFDVAVLLAHQPLPAGPRVAIVSNSGGVVTICADACEAHGLEVQGHSTLDLGAFAAPEAYENSIHQALAHREVDSLIVIFARVGEGDPDPVRLAILQGVQAAEASTGVIKPVLLCLMGLRGAISLDAGSAGTGADASARSRTFPSFRFPESAAQALGHAARYAAFRRQPAGRLLWYEDAKGAAARHRIELELEAKGLKELELGGPETIELLGNFGIPVGPGTEAMDQVWLRLDVDTDPQFGPVFSLARVGQPPLACITPLMDTDAQAMAEAAGLRGHAGLVELLGRVSQLVEEVPWVTGLRGEMRVSTTLEAASASLLAEGLRIHLRKS